MIPGKSHILRAGLVVGMCLFFSLSCGCGGTEVQSQSPRYIEGQLLVKFKKATSPARIQEINRTMGAEVSKIIPGIQVYQLRIPENKAVPEMVRRFSALAEMEYAEPNYQYQILTPQKE